MDPHLLQQIRQCQSLPTLPAIAVQVLDLVRDPDAHIPQLARLISKDPALASKILRTVNSSMYARPTKVGKLTQALALLGLQTVRVLVLGFSLVRNLKGYKNKGFRPLEYWRRAIYSATSALTLAQRFGLEWQEEAFVAALLMDLGMLALDEVVGEPYGRLNEKARGHSDLARLEEATLQTTHGEVSGVMARTWGLPAVLAVPMEFHHKPAAVEDAALRRLAQVCYLAGRCADVFVEESATGAVTEIREYCAAHHEMSEADCDALLAQVSKRTAEIATLFDVNVNTGVSYESVLRKANDSVIQLTLADQQQARIENTQLREQASLDPLTGLANRGRFDAFLATAMAAAVARNKPLALLLLDIDHFKGINDRHGHQNGDFVLRTVGRLLSISARPGDLAARYGGEELAMILPDTTRAAGASLAENIRRSLAAAPVVNGQTSMEVTASLGVAAFEPGAVIRDPAHLLKAADMALYAAKRSGRNCVRVFSGNPAPSAKPAA